MVMERVQCVFLYGYCGRSKPQSKLHITEDFYPLVSLWKVIFFLMLCLASICIPLLVRSWRKLNEKYQYTCNSAALRLPIKSVEIYSCLRSGR
ncbi:hypothetical protein AAFF_G00335160 [Aldrovandia affinis]|uniref:Uncharacterized protein n=1 Tax=Aldrovandia affinis TaxID=143900 RepID=A0AAD7WPW8_9TELE|nr:hypothetical protein AAFF_G00335160 [Aldrovandia affinis]